MESESKLLAEPVCGVMPDSIENLLGKGMICEGSVRVRELFSSGTEVTARTVKSGKVQYKNVKGGMICNLSLQDHISHKHGGMSSTRWLWALLYVMLVSYSPVTAEDSGGAEVKFCG